MHNLIKTKQEIIQWLAKYDIEGYELVPDEKYGYVVNADDVCIQKEMKYIEVKFGHIKNDFIANGVSLMSLYGSPEEVGRVFNVSQNKLTSLMHSPRCVRHFFATDNQISCMQGAPDQIERDFVMSKNSLVNLMHCPENVGEDYHFQYNKLESLEGVPRVINRGFYCNNNKLKNLLYFPEKINSTINFEENKRLKEFQYAWEFNVLYEEHKRQVIEKNMKQISKKIAQHKPSIKEPSKTNKI